MNILKLCAHPTYLLCLLNCTVVLRSAIEGTNVKELASPCSASEFKCVGSGVCIPAARLCDGVMDCGDGSDEEKCAAVRKCSASQFQCTNRQCISSWRRCDGQYDCDDHSDETAPFCGAETCRPDLFRCKDHGGPCIPSEWRCDGTLDCADGSDESMCPRRACSSREFQCANGHCIRRALLCDGHPDCADASDEDVSTTCVPAGCRDKEFACGPAGGGCVPATFQCDGYGDCSDGSDEKDCAVIRPTGERLLRRRRARDALVALRRLRRLRRPIRREELQRLVRRGRVQERPVRTERIAL
nr:very low-density lipoprotein receptor-like [Dermacentor andersoni]